MSLLSWTQENAQEAAEYGAQASEYASESGGTMPIAEVPAFIEGHIADGPYIEFFKKIYIDGLAMPSFEVAGLTIDFSLTRHMIFMVLAAFLCMAVFIPLARAAVNRDPNKAPSGFSNAMEALILFFRDSVARQNIGHGGDAYAPFLLTIFFFILFMNVMGLLPTGITATANLSVTAALAVIAFIATEVSGMRALGPAGYARTIFFMPHGMNPVIAFVVMLILAPVEFLGKLTKPFALAIRLFANMMAGHTLVLAVLGLIFVFGNLAVMGAAIAAASVIMILELFVAFLQAFIFTMLTAVFIGLIRHAH